MLGASKYTRSNRLLSHARSIKVCTEQPFFSVMLGASKYARTNRLLCHARSSVVCTEQPFTQAFSARRNRFSLPCSEHRSMHGSTVYSDRKMHGATAVFSVMLGASKCAQNNRLISHARSIEACTEQPFNQSCSEH